MLREINFKVFRKLLRKSKRKAITIDIDSSVVNVEGHQEVALKGYNPKKPGNHCYNLQFAFCDELKAYITGFVRSGNAYTVNGAAEWIAKMNENGGNDAKIKRVQPQPSPWKGENIGKKLQTWNFRQR